MGPIQNPGKSIPDHTNVLVPTSSRVGFSIALLPNSGSDFIVGPNSWRAPDVYWHSHSSCHQDVVFASWGWNVEVVKSLCVRVRGTARAVQDYIGQRSVTLCLHVARAEFRANACACCVGFPLCSRIRCLRTPIEMHGRVGVGMGSPWRKALEEGD